MTQIVYTNHQFVARTIKDTAVMDIRNVRLDGIDVEKLVGMLQRNPNVWYTLNDDYGVRNG
jgi:hypothetical protein